MFGIFKQAPRHSKQDIYNQLGETSDQFIEIAAKSSELDVAMLGACEVRATVDAAEKAFGIKVQPDSAFAGFISVMEMQDFSGMAEIIRDMGECHSQIETKSDRGALIYLWLCGIPRH
jgi:hypothetical protein